MKVVRPVEQPRPVEMEIIVHGYLAGKRAASTMAT